MSSALSTRSGSRSKPFPKVGCCMLCGTWGKLTREHVVSKLLFQKVAHSTLIVPACKACQTAKGRGEQILWKLINLDIQGELHPVAMKNQAAILRDELRLQRELGRLGPVAKALTTQRFADLQTPSGLFAGQAAGLQWSFAPALNTLRYTARGLY